MNVSVYFKRQMSILVQKKFEINGDLRVRATLYDNHCKPIPPEEFCTVVHNYK